jgi:hypothetical protein
MNAAFDLGLHALHSAYRAGTLSVRHTIEEVLARIAWPATTRCGYRGLPTPPCDGRPTAWMSGATRSASCCSTASRSQ